MSKLKVLVTGATGLVGSHLVESYSDFTLLKPSSEEFNLLDTKSIESYLAKNSPDWIVNFAAFTDVNAADAQRGDISGLAWQINVVGVENILKCFKSKNFIQISTDMVFEGSLNNPGPYDEDATPPETDKDLTWYGFTKNRAEKLVKERGATILRIIYPVRVEFDKKLDYIRGPLKKHGEGNLHPLFNDQQICISYIPEVSETITKIIETESHGVFHACSDTTTPFELIKRALDEIGEGSSDLKSSSVVEFLKTQTNPSRYPVWGGLKTKKTEDVLETHFSTWQTVIEYLVAEGLKIPGK